MKRIYYLKQNTKKQNTKRYHLMNKQKVVSLNKYWSVALYIKWLNICNSNSFIICN